MAAVPPISDSLSAPPSSAPVLPPSTQPALGLPPTDSTQASNQATAANQSTAPSQTAAASNAAAAASDTAASIAPTTTSPVTTPTTQPLGVVLDALATAGVDAAVNQQILAPAVGQPTGTFSIFMEQLFTALAAQSAAAEQAAQTQAAQQTTPVTSQTPSTTTVTAFTTNAQGAAPNSTLEVDVQNLAQTVNAQQSTNPTLAAEASSTNTTTLTPLQQSFDQFVADVGGTPNSTSLGGFLQALATNLHTVQTPLGNIVNSQT